MAGDWIKLEHTTPDKPEVVRMATILKIDQDSVAGKLLRVWIWADQNSVSGEDITVTEAFIDRLTNKKGFASAMRAVGWLENGDETLTFPSFQNHNGKTAKARVETNRRVSEHRERRRPVPKSEWRAVIERDGNKCVYCDRPSGKYIPPETASDAVISVDHVIPACRGGSNTPKNLVAACMSCNTFKGDRTPDECGLKWPLDSNGERYGNEEVTEISLPKALPEKRRDTTTTQRAALCAVSKPADAPTVDQLRTLWPSLNVDAELTDAGRYCQKKHGRSDVDLSWFAEHWLPKAVERVKTTATPSTKRTPQEPEGWRSWLEDNCPGNVYAKGGIHEDRTWSEMDVSTREYIERGMGIFRAKAV